ncbi:MAG TPA: hypothetical protein VJ600_05920 [Holophagaceae bacterium]|nr:hypothetical protein [Holophagaceae bacterium]
MRPTSIIGAGLALALVAGAGYGLWRLVQRPPRVEAPASGGEEHPLFQVSHLGKGELIELQPQPLTPLRAVRWVGPLPGRAALAQILTQTDKQQVGLFIDGRQDSFITVPRPEGVPETFFRLAELRDAALCGDALALLYRNGSGDPLLLVLDRGSQALRWWSRLPAEHLAVDPSQPNQLWLWGATLPPVPLGTGLEGRAPGAERKVAFKPLPKEVGEVTATLPLGPQAFALAHRNGCSVSLPSGWIHLPNPPADPLLGFYGLGGALARGGKQAYWQPGPGLLFQVNPDGSATPVDLGSLGLPAASALDARLLRLRGADPDGSLWFDLAMPQLLAPAAPTAPATSSPDPQTDPNAAATAPAPDPHAAWEAYLKSGVDRVYRWKPGGKLELVDISAAWKTCGAPPGVFQPAGVDLRPEAGGFLLGTDQKRWWLPLQALVR